MDVGISELNSGAFVTWKLVQNFWHLPEFTDVPRNTSEISCEMYICCGRVLGMYIFTNPAVFFNIVQKGGGGQTHVNKTISDGGITVDFSIIKVHTSN